MAIGTTLALIGAGSSLAGGLSSLLANDSAQQEVPDALTGQIDQLQNRQYFRPLLQRLIQNDQGFANISQTLASQGVDSPAIATEQRQALENQRTDAVSGAVQQLEGTRLNALNQNLGQLNRINARNTQMRQQEIQNRLSAIGQMASGIGGSIAQGVGANNAQATLDKALNNMQNQPSPDLGGLNMPQLNMPNFSSFGNDGGTSALSNSPLGTNPNAIGLNTGSLFSGQNQSIGMGNLTTNPFSFRR